MTVLTACVISKSTTTTAHRLYVTSTDVVGDDDGETDEAGHFDSVWDSLARLRVGHAAGVMLAVRWGLLKFLQGPWRWWRMLLLLRSLLLQR